MNVTLDRETTEAPAEQLPGSGLFVCWFDANCGHPPADWWWECPGPQSLGDALRTAAEVRLCGFPAKVMPDSVNPRPDGRWDEPRPMPGR